MILICGGYYTTNDNQGINTISNGTLGSTTLAVDGRDAYRGGVYAAYKLQETAVIISGVTVTGDSSTYIDSMKVFAIALAPAA